MKNPFKAEDMQNVDTRVSMEEAENNVKSFCEGLKRDDSLFRAKQNDYSVYGKLSERIAFVTDYDTAEALKEIAKDNKISVCKLVRDITHEYVVNKNSNP